MQGLTEFLPVSSSGHLVLGAYWLGLREPQLLFDVIVHTATLVAVGVFYRRSLVDMARAGVGVITGSREARTSPHARLLAAVVVGSVPTAIIGLLFRHPLEALFGAPRVVAAMLLVTAVLLLITRLVRRAGPGHPVRWWEALVIGVVQGFAIIPGISRSGSTIAAALLLGVEREEAARYSFVLSMPAIAGALLLHLREPGVLAQAQVGPLLVGFLAAAGVGLVALRLLVPMVQRGHLHYFAPYLLVLGGLGLWLIR